MAALPKENLTPTDLKLREQAQAGAKAAKERLEPKSQKVHHVVALPPAQGKLPWDRAEGLVNERLAKYGHTMECANSSVRMNSCTVHHETLCDVELGMVDVSCIHGKSSAGHVKSRSILNLCT